MCSTVIEPTKYSIYVYSVVQNIVFMCTVIDLYNI